MDESAFGSCQENNTVLFWLLSLVEAGWKGGVEGSVGLLSLISLVPVKGTQFESLNFVGRAWRCPPSADQRTKQAPQRHGRVSLEWRNLPAQTSDLIEHRTTFGMNKSVDSEPGHNCNLGTHCQKLFKAFPEWSCYRCKGCHTGEATVCSSLR